MNPKTSRGTTALAAGILAILIGGNTSQAETITWDNTAGGNWHDAANWDPNDIPNESGEDALVADDGFTYTINLNSGATLDRVTIANPDATLDLLGYALATYLAEGLDNYGTVLTSTPGGWTSLNCNMLNRPGAELQILSGCNLLVGGGDPTITNNGTILVNSDANPADAYFYVNAGGGTVHLAGTGEMILQVHDDHYDARVMNYSGSMAQGADHTIRGAGTIQVPLTNDGYITADVPGQKILITGSSITNNGTITATNGSRVESNATITQGVGGEIIGDGGRVDLYGGGWVSGGTFSSANGGAIGVLSGHYTYLFDVTNLGDIHIPGNGAIYLGSTEVTNEGTILINSDLVPSPAHLYSYSTDPVLISGSGEIRLQHAGDPNQARLETYSGSFVNGPDHTIHGTGRIGAVLTNDGLIAADVSGERLTLLSNHKTNNGTMAATDGGILAASGMIITQGPTGVMLADGGTITLEQAVDIRNGTLRTMNGGIIEKVYDGSYAYLWDLTNEGDCHIRGGGAIYLRGSTMTNDGTILVNSDQATTDAHLYNFADGSGELRVEGSGEIVLQTSGSDYGDARLATYSGLLIQGPEHTIRGEGYIVAVMDNEGLIVADVADRPLVLDSGGKTNRSTFMATGGGILRIRSGAIAQTAEGVILADGGGIEFDHASYITGGTLQTVNGGTIDATPGQSELYEMTNEGDLGIRGGAGCYIGRGLFTNNGTITINSDLSSTDAYLLTYGSDDECFIDGTGEIVLQTTGDPGDARFYVYSLNCRQGAAHTIRGEGLISQYLINNGMIVADVTGRGLYFNNGWLANEGVVRAMGGGLFDVTVSCQNNGIMEAMGGGTFRLGYPWNHYSQGSYTFTGGTWQIFENSIMRWINADVRDLRATLRFYGPGSMLYRDDGTLEALANLQTIGAGGMLETHSGRDFATAGNLTVDFGGLSVGEGCAFSVSDAYTQVGHDEDPNLAGLTCVNGTLVATTDPIDIQGGRLCGCGTIQNSVVCAGRTNPGASAGELTITGDFTQTEEGTCWIELAGLNAGEYDHLLVGGEATLAGRLVVTSIEGYEPNVGDRFTILSCTTRTGEFTLETGSPGVGLLYDTYYYPDHIEIEIFGDPSCVPESEIADDTPGTPGDESDTQIESDDPFAAPELIPTALGLYSRPLPGGALLVLDLPQPGQVTLEVFDFTGRRLAVLTEGAANAGRHSYAWDGMTQAGARAASGVYLARARVADGSNADVMRARLLLVR